jgi:VanZ family protein
MSYTLFADLTESKLIPSYWHISNFTAEQIGDITYMYFMGLYLLSMDPSTSRWAREYARKTISLNGFDAKVNTANDLYVMLFALKGGVGFKDKLVSQKYLSRLRINWRKIHDFLYDMSLGLPRNHRSFLLNLDDGLNIHDTTLKSIRRSVMEWQSLTPDEQQLVIGRILTKVRNLAPKCEAYNYLQQLARTPENTPEVNTGLTKGLL